MKQNTYSKDYVPKIRLSQGATLVTAYVPSEKGLDMVYSVPGQVSTRLGGHIVLHL